MDPSEKVEPVNLSDPELLYELLEPITAEERAEAIWKWADADCDGVLSQKEASCLLEKLGNIPSGETLSDEEFADFCDDMPEKTDPSVGITKAVPPRWKK